MAGLLAPSRLESMCSREHVAIAVAVLFISWLFRYRWRQRNKVGPKTWPLFEASLEQLINVNRIHDWILGYFEKGLLTVCVPMLFYNQAVYTLDPANMEHIFKTNSTNYPRGKQFREYMKELYGDGILAVDGSAWQKQRRIAGHEFSSKILRDFSTDVFKAYALRLVRLVNSATTSEEHIDMQDLFMRLTLDTTCKISFGMDFGSLSPEFPDVPFSRALEDVSRGCSLRFLGPLWRLKRFFNIGSEAAVRKSVKILDDFTYKVIADKTHAVKTLSEENVGLTKPDLISRFLLFKEDPETTFSSKDLRDVAMNFIAAGRSTTGATLSWLIYMLTLHEDVAAKIYNELCSFEQEMAARDEGNLLRGDQAKENFEDRVAEFAQLVTYASVSKLQYLHAAISEVLRLYPAVPLLPKAVLADDVLPDGTKVRAGDIVLSACYCMGRAKHVWGADACEYRPERWLEGGVFKPESPFKFTAFQSGPHMCPGKDSAYLQMKITSAILCRFFKFHPVPGHVVKYKMKAALTMEHGLKLSATRRR